MALGVAGGYLLGRSKKMKLALMLGGLAAGRRAGGPGELLAQGSKLVSRSPELSRLAGDVRGRLLDAGKDAALAVVTRQVESWADRVAGPLAGVAAHGEEGDSGEASADGAPERSSSEEETSAAGRSGGANRSRSGGSGTTAHTRRPTSERGSGRTARTARTAKNVRPARAGQEAGNG